MKRILITKELTNQRLDKLVSELLKDHSRSEIQGYIESGYILINDKESKSSYKVRENDKLTIKDFPKEEYNLEAEDIPLDIVYEDDDVIVINKPKV